MKKVLALARIVDPNGNASEGLSVRLEMFALGEGEWQSLGEGVTDEAGDLRLEARLALADDLPAPNLRLVRTAGGAILSDGGPIRYQKSKALLTIAFGEIIDLGEAEIPASSILAGGVRKVRPVAGISAPAAAVIARTPTVDSEATALRSQLDASNRRVGELEKSLADTSRDSQARVATLEKQIADASKAGQRDAARVAELEKSLADTTRDSQARVATLEKQVADASRAGQRDAARVAELEKSLADTTRDNQARVAALEKQVADAGRVNAQLTRDAARVAELEKNLADSARENARLAAEAKRVADLESRLAATEQANAALSAPVAKKVAMTAVATNLGEQLGTAQLRIREQPGSLALAGVKIRLKGIVEDGATTVTLPDAEDLAKPEFASGLADIELDFSSAPSPAAADTVEVPDVRRMTESAVRQLLTARGLRLEAVKGAAGSTGVAAGQAGLQAPSAGTRAQRGAVVTVMFAE